VVIRFAHGQRALDPRDGPCTLSPNVFMSSLPPPTPCCGAATRCHLTMKTFYALESDTPWFWLLPPPLPHRKGRVRTIDGRGSQRLVQIKEAARFRQGPPAKSPLRVVNSGSTPTMTTTTATTFDRRVKRMGGL